MLCYKVHVFWEGHKNLKNQLACFDNMYWVNVKTSVWPSHNISTLQVQTRLKTKGICFETRIFWGCKNKKNKTFMLNTQTYFFAPNQFLMPLCKYKETLPQNMKHYFSVIYLTRTHISANCSKTCGSKPSMGR